MAVSEGAVRGEGGRCIDTEYRGKARRVYLSLSAITFNGILRPVEEELTPQEFEQVPFDRARYIRLEIKKVKVRLMIYLFALRSWHLIKMLDHV